MKFSFFAGIVRESDGSGFSVYFPDFPEIAAGGETIDEAIRNASDGLYLTLLNYKNDKKNYPSPSPLEDAKEKVKAERVADELTFPKDTIFHEFTIELPEISFNPMHQKYSNAISFQPVY